VKVRAEQEFDIESVRRVNLAAFERDAEANLVDTLRNEARPLVSLVADDDGAIVGHILFSPVTLSSQTHLLMFGLAPMAVLPDRQRQGIGSALVRRGFEECRDRGCTAVVVLGHPAYYPKFGFKPASRFGLTCEYDVPDDVFMAVELQAGALSEMSGVVRYHPAFAEL
jgi:putative acetyltransferase